MSDWYKPGKNASYLYDGVYAEDLDDMIVLSAARGSETHFVCLEDLALKEFFRFIERTRGVKITMTRVKERAE